MYDRAKQFCLNCVFFMTTGANSGLCRRYPKVWTGHWDNAGTPMKEFSYPSTTKSQWCGEYKDAASE